MSRFTLLLRPNGSALLVTAEAFRAEQLEPVRAALDEWVQNQYQVAVLVETDIVRITDLEVDLESRVIRRVPAETAT